MKKKKEKKFKYSKEQVDFVKDIAKSIEENFGFEARIFIPSNSKPKTRKP